MTELAEDTSAHHTEADVSESPEKLDSDALTRSAGRGALWQIVGAGSQFIIHMGAIAVLARVLSKEDFGIMGMALVVKGLITTVAGLGTGTGVTTKRDATQDDLSTAFWMEVAMNAVLFTIAFVAAPIAAEFYDAPGLKWVLRAISITFLLSALGSTSGTLLRKRLRFGTSKIIESSGFALQSALSVVFAVVFHLGYWSLVLGILISTAAQTAAGIVCARWRPSIRFSGESFRHLFRYSINGLGSSLTGYLQYNLDYLLVGKFLSVGALGLYQFAYTIPHQIFNRISRPISGVLLPTLSKANVSDMRLAAGYIKTAKYIGLIVFPMLGGLAAVAYPTVAVLFSEKWLPIVVPLQILCFRAMFACILQPVNTIFLCKNRPDIPFKFGICAVVVTFIAVSAFGLAFRLVGVAIGMVVSLAPHFFFLCIAFRMTHTSPKRFLTAMAPAAVSATASSFAALLVSNAIRSLGGGMAVALVSAIATGAAVYIAVMRCLFADTIRDIFQTIRIVLGRRRTPSKSPL